MPTTHHQSAGENLSGGDIRRVNKTLGVNWRWCNCDEAMNWLLARANTWQRLWPLASLASERPPPLPVCPALPIYRCRLYTAVTNGSTPSVVLTLNRLHQIWLCYRVIGLHWLVVRACMCGRATSWNVWFRRILVTLESRRQALSEQKAVLFQVWICIVKNSVTQYLLFDLWLT